MMAENVLPFGARDGAIDRQEIVDTLRRMIDGHESLKGFSANFKLASRERVWERDRVFAGGTRQPPVTFQQFICEHYPVGLGATYEIVENLIRGDNEALALWTELTKRKGGRPQEPDNETLDNIQGIPIAPTGTSAAAGIRKLTKAATEGNEKAQTELAATVAGRKSVNAACIDAGLRKSTRIDADVKRRCDKSNAEIIVEYVPHERLDALVADLFAAGHKSLGIAIKNLTGESIMDRRYGARA